MFVENWLIFAIVGVVKGLDDYASLKVIISSF
jgi:hypothetical protein